MARLMVCVLALCAAGALADPRDNWSKIGADILKQRQMDLMTLYDHIHEPIAVPKCQDIASKWTIENNYEKFNNITAAKTWVNIMKNNWNLPRGVPFSVYEPAQVFEAVTLFHMLYSAKDYDTFYNTAVYLRDILNEGLYVYSLSVAIIYRQDTQGIVIPPIYEVFPSFFNNGEIMVTAQRINTHGHRFLKHYPSTFVWDDNVVIRWNSTAWPYFSSNSPVSYFTHDYDLNDAQYFLSLVTPYWLGGEEIPVIHKKNRGEAWWFAHKQLLARYYMERLSNCLAEIPEITQVVEEGFSSGLLYSSGIPYPSRPNHFHLDNPEFANTLEQAEEYERRIWEAIDKGFYINRKGEHVSLLTNAGVEVLGRLIDSNADSPNRYYYKDFISLWKKVLGNSIKPGHQYVNHLVPLVVPSALENYQTALRDPAYYMIWKRVLKMFVHWQKQMPSYKPEELIMPNVEIQKVEVDKLVTYFENTYMNISTHLWQTEFESKNLKEEISVLAQHPRLNHKPFNVKIYVKSPAAKKVLVKLFLAPKYDSKGYEIPLSQNTENFFMLEQFTYDMTAGECVISRKSTDFSYTAKDWPSAHELYVKLLKGEWTPSKRNMNVFPHRLLLPKGKAGGMKFQLMVFIQEFKEYKEFDAPGYYTIGYPTDRPLHAYQVQNVKNIFFEDVVIYHKDVPEVYVPHTL